MPCTKTSYLILCIYSLLASVQSINDLSEAALPTIVHPSDASTCQFTHLDYAAKDHFINAQCDNDKHSIRHIFSTHSIYQSCNSGCFCARPRYSNLQVHLPVCIPETGKLGNLIPYTTHFQTMHHHTFVEGSGKTRAFLLLKKGLVLVSWVSNEPLTAFLSMTYPESEQELYQLDLNYVHDWEYSTVVWVPLDGFGVLNFEPLDAAQPVKIRYSVTPLDGVTLLSAPKAGMCH
jgi:hypothetical protein